MANKFEVTLVGNDQLGGMIDQVNEKVRGLSESAEKASAGVGSGLAGKENQAGLSQLGDKFSELAVSARNNVQNIGDMIPPLKNFGELSGKIFGGIGRLGLLGGAVSGVVTVANSVGNMAKHAQDIEISARNIGVSAEKYTMILGAFKLSGVGEEQARASVSALKDAFEDMLYGRGEGNKALAQLDAFNFDRSMIPTKYDEYGNMSVDIEKLLVVLGELYRSIDNPETRHNFMKRIGADASVERLFRNDESVEGLYEEAYKRNLVQTQEVTDRLTEFDKTLTSAAASLEGWSNRQKDAWSWLFLDYFGWNEKLKGIAEEGDKFAWAYALGGRDKNDAEINRLIERDADYDEFVKTLGWWDGGRTRAALGFFSENDWDKFVDFKKGRDTNWQNPFDRQFESKTAQSLQNMSGMAYINQGSQGIKQSYLQHLEKAYGLPHGILDRIWSTESGRGKNMFSPAGAEGHFQFMPDIGEKFGLFTTEDRMNFAKSAEAAARYMQQSLNAFGGDVPRSVASYNWGGAWNRWGGGMPLETQNYLKAILPGLPNNYKPKDYGGINAYDGSNAQKLADEFVGALNRNPTQITVRIENSSGHSQTVSTHTGATVTTQMDF